MARAIPGDEDYYGKVNTAKDKYPTSSLVEAFKKNPHAAEAIVLRGYPGTTTVIDRAIEFIRIAGRNGLDDAEVTRRTADVEGMRKLAEANLLRIYLTPRLDRYVEFERSCLVAWRVEANSLRQDMITVWLRRYDDNDVKITYRAIEEAVIGAPPATYIGGELLDDALSESAAQSSAWGGVTGSTVGNKLWTRPFCDPT